jgi:hypothetical protein
MSLFDNIPEGTDIIEIRKKVNKMLSESKICADTVLVIEVY